MNLGTNTDFASNKCEESVSCDNPFKKLSLITISLKSLMVCMSSLDVFEPGLVDIRLVNGVLDDFLMFAFELFCFAGEDDNSAKATFVIAELWIES